MDEAFHVGPTREAIKAFRGSRLPPGNRKILRSAVTTYGTDFGDSQLQFLKFERQKLRNFNSQTLTTHILIDSLLFDSYFLTHTLTHILTLDCFDVSLHYQVTNMEFQRDGSSRIGRQSQTWLRLLLWNTIATFLLSSFRLIVMLISRACARNVWWVEGCFSSCLCDGLR